MKLPPRGLLVFALLSGLTSLVYEVVWAKGLSLYLGGTAFAQTTVLAAFLGGLALGNARLGAEADAADDPLAFYGRLELWLGLVGLASPLLLTLLDRSLDLARAAGPAGLAAAGMLGGGVLVALPAFLIGGTLPALARARAGDYRTSVSRLYGANCGGAVLGSLGAAFALIPALGLDGAFRAAALLDVGLGLAALSAARDTRARRPLVEDRAAPPAATLALPAAALLAYLFGTATLLYETAWIRLLAMILGSSVYSFAVMLAAVIGGIGLGGWLVSTRVLRKVEPAALLGLCQAGAAAVVGLSMPVFERLPYYLILLKGLVGHGRLAFYYFEAAQLGLCLLATLGPATLLGMSLPLAASLAPPEASGTGRRLGLVFSASALGNVLGALAGLVLMPALGVSGLIRAGMLINGLAGLWLMLSYLPWPLWKRVAAAAVLLGSAAATARHPAWRPEIVAYGVFRVRPEALTGGYAAFRRSWTTGLKLLYHKDDRNATITVFGHESGARSLQVNGKTDASTGRDMRTQVTVGHLPLLLQPGAREGLLIGWGSGVTAGAMLRHPLERLDAVEISPAVIEASYQFLPENHSAIDDPRLNLALEDAKTFLRRGDRAYDVIVSEPSNPWMAGVGNLFTVEFYRQAKRRLKPGGVMVQWFHLYEMDDDTARLILRTFASEFQYVTLWRLLNRDILLMGSNETMALDFPAIERGFRDPEVWEDLKVQGLLSLPTVLGAQSAGTATVRLIAGDGPLNRDRFPRLEYRAPKAHFRKSVAARAEAADDRNDPERRKKLMLAGYLAARGKPLTRLEFMDLLSDPSADLGGEPYRAWAEEWTRRFPRDPEAFKALYRFEAKSLRPTQARAALKRALLLDPRNRELQKLWAAVREDDEEAREIGAKP